MTFITQLYLKLKANNEIKILGTDDRNIIIIAITSSYHKYMYECKTIIHVTVHIITTTSCEPCSCLTR